MKSSRPVRIWGQRLAMGQAPIFMIEDVDTATQHAATAIAEMAMREISPTPGNFCVWYNYISGSVPELRRDLDALLLSGKTVSASNIQNLFDKYFREPDAEERLHQTGDDLQNTLTDVIRQVTQAGLDANEFGKTLTKANSSLGTGRIDSASMKDLVGELITATKLIGQRNQALEAQLKQSSAKVTALQSRLDAARRDALTDALTGIGNRKSFDLAVQFRAQQATEQKSDLCLLIMDIDHFKKFNDSFGHRVGDQVLKLVGTKLKQAIGGNDSAARYGGEEFAVLMPQTKMFDAVDRADKFRTGLGAHSLKNRSTGQVYGAVTVSIGVARYRAGESLEGFITRADQALYRAKKEGRNRVVAEAS
ncbi:GGDEF domain-containing protein [Dongia rigui]|uniref:diguanylate cyclase n=1 Tax=Dongia rigui TaxID=940149 RepID=A0ABU5E4S8_9PROT|nr:GGDEF domain-containing protein [Dongia rigui]MDY0874189.1 GGDEF domain-containing protein [Dongia rigui]